MKKRFLDYGIDIILINLILIVGIIGIIVFPGFLHLLGFGVGVIPKVELLLIHHWLGLLFGIITISHILLHWKWFIGRLKKYSQKVKQNTSKKHGMRTVNNLVILGAAISFLLVFITGVIKFPEFIQLFDLNIRLLPFYEISLIHDWFGLMTIGLLILHILLHLKWITSTTRLLISQIIYFKIL